MAAQQIPLRGKVQTEVWKAMHEQRQYSRNFKQEKKNMNDNLLYFAKKQAKILAYTFTKQGFNYSELNEALMFITMNTIAATNLTNNGICPATEQQMRNYVMSACDEIIKFCTEYISELMCKED